MKWWPNEFGLPPDIKDFDDGNRLRDSFVRAKDLVDEQGFGV